MARRVIRVLRVKKEAPARKRVSCLRERGVVKGKVSMVGGGLEEGGGLGGDVPYGWEM